MEIIKDANELRNALYDLDRGQIIYASKKLVWKQIIGSIEGKSFSTRELQDKIEITCTR